MSIQATIEIIEQVFSHPNADSLELVKVLGFQCVVPKNMYKNNDMIIFIQPDSVLPKKDHSWAAEFLKYAPTRVKAIKLRGEWSEGLIIPVNTLYNIDIKIGLEVSDILGITHYESTNSIIEKEGIIGQLAYNIPKTDEERFENLRKTLITYYGQKVDVTLKIDGQSWSVFYILNKENPDNDEFGITGRKVRYDINLKNNYTNHIVRYDIHNKLRDYCRKYNVSICLRGESYGKGIQKMKNNPHSDKEPGLAIFSVFLIDQRQYANKGEKHYFVDLCKELNLPMVDMIEENVELTPELLTKYSSELKKLNNQPFEGVVIKGSNFTFKVINKHYDSLK